LTTIRETAGLQFAMSPLWSTRSVRPVRRGMPYLVEALAALVALSLLLAFFQVVRGSVLQGERLRQVMAAHSAATYQCHSLATKGAADACLRQLNASVNSGQMQSMLLVSAAAPVN
jgi:hypothetical protein